MAGTFSQTLLMGRLTRDPELRYTPGGTAVCQLGVATDRYVPGKGGSKGTEVAEFHAVIAWAHTAEFLGKYGHKGDLVYVVGENRTRSWDDPATSQKRYKTEVHARDVKLLGRRGPSKTGDASEADAPLDYFPDAQVETINPEDIPF